MINSIRIGTRGSTLALAQTAWVRNKLAEQYPDIAIETIEIKTSGDRFIAASLQAIGGKGVFTKELEEALFNREIDIAVHSMKDLPTLLPPGLTVGAIPAREDARDVLVSGGAASLQRLSHGAKVGTGSLRRTAQVRNCRPDLLVAPIRGNVDTRLKKLDSGEYDALVIAAAGLKRIGLEDRITEYLSNDVCLSAPGQGALGLETREDDSLREQLDFLHDATAFAEVSAERALLRRLGGGCQVPVGAKALVDGEGLTICAVVAKPDGSRLCRGKVSGSVTEANQLGELLAERLLSEGAQQILDVR